MGLIYNRLFQHFRDHIALFGIDEERGMPAEALSALTNLGYAPGEAAGAVAEASRADPAAETPALIRAALKLLAPKG